mmetsp:Transcript_88836/g.256195  ORF Transcript_88836/g.256195 Transcript_88836/m.256195 type:complete len:214 (-) Transcript_88836:921-1562(-)
MIGRPPTSVHSWATVQRKSVKNERPKVAKTSAPLPRRWWSPKVSRKINAKTYNGTAKRNTEKTSVRMPPRVPEINIESSLNTAKRPTRTILAIRRRRRTRMTAKLEVLLSSSAPLKATTVVMTSRIAKMTKVSSRRCQCLSWPRKKSRQPATTHCTTISAVKMKVKMQSSTTHPGQSGATSQLTPIATALTTITTLITELMISNNRSDTQRRL